MLRELEYSVTFPTPTPGARFAGHFKFEPGVTAVTGPNGAAKSLGTIEMARYGLFGMDAFRGKASDYKSLEMWMEFDVAGQSYRVERGKKERLLDSEGDVLAVKPAAVNAEIRKILGYSLDVFDIINACGQKQSERLSQLKPTARKQLIDEVVGLTQNEEVEKACKAEALGLTREADALAANLPAVVEAIEPAGYMPSTSLEMLLGEARDVERRRAELERQAVEPAPVQEPVEARVDIVHIERQYDAAKAHNAERERLRRAQADIPTTIYTAQELEAARERRDWHSDMKLLGEAPSLGLTLAEVDAALETYAQFRALSVLPDVETECPNCQHHFHTRPELPELPPYTAKQLADERVKLEKHAVPMPPCPAGPDLSEQQIMDAERALRLAPELAQIEAQITDELPVPDLENARRIARLWSDHDTRHSLYETHLKNAAEAQAALLHLPPPYDLAAMERTLIDARVYEQALASAAASMAQREATLDAITEKRERALAFKEGASALALARTTFKAHLTPSLSRVASALLMQMTGGALRDVAVDEDMNITVLGQEISTLSGAGATAANLALRIGLGRVLVSKVFPVFIGDEIDSDMDATRAQQTAECLANIDDVLEQVILISHKSLENVEHRIELG